MTLNRELLIWRGLGLVTTLAFAPVFGYAGNHLWNTGWSPETLEILLWWVVVLGTIGGAYAVILSFSRDVDVEHYFWIVGAALCLPAFIVGWAVHPLTQYGPNPLSWGWPMWAYGALDLFIILFAAMRHGSQVLIEGAPSGAPLCCV